MDTLITSASEIKSLGNGKFEGYLVRFSTDQQPDLAGDFFTAETDFGLAEGEVKSTPVYYNHALDPTLKTRKIGTATMQIKDAGVWFEGQIAKADAYNDAVILLLEANRLGASSGTASHLVQREASGKAFHIKHWPLGLDASLTVEPCDPYNHVVSIKSIEGNVKSIAEILREMEGGTKAGEIKASALGDMTPAIAVAAFDRMSSKLSSFVYQQLWGDSWGGCCAPMDADAESAEPIDRASIAQALTEYTDTVLAVLDALLALPKADAPTVKTFLAHFDRAGKSEIIAQLAALPIKAYLETMGAVISDSDRRLAWYAEQREIKQGRSISDANLASFRDIRDGMKDAHAKMSEHIATLTDIISRHSKSETDTNLSPSTNHAVAHEFARYLAIGAAGAGVPVNF